MNLLGVQYYWRENGRIPLVFSRELHKVAAYHPFYFQFSSMAFWRSWSTKLGLELSTGGRIGGMLFADDFVGVSDSEDQLQKLIDVVHAYCCKWRLKANVSKSAVMVFAKDVVDGCWRWGECNLPTVSKYTYLGIDFQCSGAWDMHIKKVVDNGRKKVNQVHSILSNRDINLSARRLLLLSVVRPTLEYGNEVWEGNKAQSASLE